MFTTTLISQAADNYDLVIYGGITAGIQAKREGRSVIVLEPTAHVGGLTTAGWGERPYPPFLDNLAEGPALLPRRLPYPEFPLRPLTLVATGTFTAAPEPVAPFTDRFTDHIGLNLLGFTIDELEADSTLDWNRLSTLTFF